MAIFIEMNSAPQVQILDEAVCILLHFKKGMNQSLLFPLIGK